MTVPIFFLKREIGECAPITGNYSAQPSGKVYSRVLERQLRLIELWIQEQQCGFHSGCRKVDQLSCPAWGSLAVCPFGQHVHCGSGEVLQPGICQGHVMGYSVPVNK